MDRNLKVTFNHAEQRAILLSSIEFLLLIATTLCKLTCGPCVLSIVMFV